MICLVLVLATTQPSLSVEVALAGFGLEQYASTFVAHGIHADDLRNLQSHDLQELGLPLADRLNFMRSLQRPPAGTHLSGSCSSGMDTCQDFIFQLAGYNTTRQKGKKLNFIIKYRYPKDVGPTTYIEYNQMRAVVLYYAEPTTDLPRDTYWEMVNLALCKNLTSHFAIAGVRSPRPAGTLRPLYERPRRPRRSARRSRCSRRSRPCTSRATTARSSRWARSRRSRSRCSTPSSSGRGRRPGRHGRARGGVRPGSRVVADDAVA